jgi:preprotein translocase subunit SecE
VARNRQRAKARKSKAREQAQSPSTQEAFSSELHPTTDAPDPIANASGAAELAKVAELAGSEPIPSGEELLSEDELSDFEAGDADGRGIEAEGNEAADSADSIDADGEGADGSGNGNRGGSTAEAPSGGAAGSGGALPKGGNRLFNFLRACWAELQRVQWPDRKQVFQATGVVLGFVVIAGAYLGLADALVSKIVNAIL